MVTLVLKNATQDGDGGGPLHNGKSDLESANKQTFLLLGWLLGSALTETSEWS